MTERPESNIAAARSPRRVGYARVSTAEQKLDLQLDALNAAGCDAVFEDHGVSGAKASRPGLDAALETLQADDILIVYKLDRLGRSVLHLADLLRLLEQRGIHFHSLSEGINTTTPGGRLVYHVFSAVAEFQRAIIVENTTAGIEAAKQRGVKIGRPRALDAASITDAYSLIRKGEATAESAAAALGVSRMTLQRAFRRLDLVHYKKSYTTTI